MKHYREDRERSYEKVVSLRVTRDCYVTDTDIYNIDGVNALIPSVVHLKLTNNFCK